MIRVHEENAKYKLLGKWVNHLTKNHPDKLIVFSEARYYKKRIVKSVKDLDNRILDEVYSSFEESVAFCVGDTDKIIKRFRSTLLELVNDEQISPMDIESMSDEEVINFVNASPKVKQVSVRKTEATTRPWLFIDIDLADHYEQLNRKGLVPAEGSIVESGKPVTGSLSQRDFFKEWMLQNLSAEDKCRLIDGLVDVNVLVDETSPNLVMFSGNGLHIWYSIPCTQKFTKESYDYFYGKFVEELKELFPTVVFDEACKDINRNMRMPYTVNLKSNPPSPVKVFYENDFDNISTSITNSLEKSRMEFKETKKTNNSGAGLFSMLYGEMSTFVSYRGFKDLFQNERMYDYLKKFLTLENICLFFNLKFKDTNKEHEGYRLISSPLREDKNPSFGFCDDTLNCTDFSKSYSMDYGEFIQIALDDVKESIGLFDLMPSTTHEAQVYAVLIAFFKDYTLNRKYPDFFKMFIEPFSAPNKVDAVDDVVIEETSKKLKRPYEQHYSQMMYFMKDIVAGINEVSRRMSTTSASNLAIHKEAMHYVINRVPRIYYFPKILNFEEETKLDKLRKVYTLSLQEFFDSFKLTIAIKSNTEVELYGVDPIGVHKPFVSMFEYSTAKSAEVQHHYGKIQTKLMLMNIPLEFQKKETAISVHGMLSTLAGLETAVNDSLTGNPITESLIRSIIMDQISRKYGDQVDPSLIDIGNIVVVNKRRYIRFNNVFLLYDGSDHTKEIGSTLPYTRNNFEILRKNSLIDRIIPYNYTGEKEHPLFDSLLDFLDNGENFARKVVNYFLGIALYPPNGHDTKAIILCGDGKNGKSVLTSVITKLFSEKYVSEFDIAPLADEGDSGRQHRMQMYDKLVNISPDSSGQDLKGEYKKLVTGDKTTVRRLYGEPVTVYPRAKYIINANRIPQLIGEAQAFVRRTLVVPLSRVISEEAADKYLLQKIVDREASAIWTTIVDNARTYKEKGITGFISVDEMRDIETALLGSNILYVFIRDYVHFDPSYEGRLNYNTFIRHYNNYRRQQDMKQVSATSYSAEVMQHIRKKFLADDTARTQITEKALQNGFSHKIKGSRGIPHLYISIPADENFGGDPVDTRRERG